MTITESPHEPSFWDALAPHHAGIEDNFLDRASLRHIASDVQPPVLVVGAGQGLIVAELLAMGLHCDGVDSSSEMVRYAKIRRGLDLIQADASAMPLADGVYDTVIYATGVIDFTSDENAIRRMLGEGRRVLKTGGKIFVAFYRTSRMLELCLERLGLLNNHVLRQRACLETYLLTPAQMIRWLAERAHTGWLGGAALMLRLAISGTLREKVTTLKMQRIVRRMESPQAFIQSAPETQPYRNADEVRKLFERLSVPVQGMRHLKTCCIAQI